MRHQKNKYQISSQPRCLSSHNIILRGSRKENTSRFCVCFIRPSYLGTRKTSTLIEPPTVAVKLQYVCDGLMFTCQIQTSNPILSWVECLQKCLKIYCIHSEFNKSKETIYHCRPIPQSPNCQSPSVALRRERPSHALRAREKVGRHIRQQCGVCLFPLIHGVHLTAKLQQLRLSGPKLKFNFDSA